MIDENTFIRLNNSAKEIISIFHQENPMKEGIVKEELRSRLYNGLDPKLFQLVLTGLTKDGSIVQDKAIIRLASHQVFLQEDAETVKEEMETFFLKAALKPPTKKELMVKFSSYRESMVREVLDLLTRDNVLVKVKEDLFYHRKSLENIQERLQRYLAEHKEIDAQNFKAMTNLSRKFSIPLLEYFDRVKLTIRVGDKRLLRG